MIQNMKKTLTKPHSRHLLCRDDDIVDVMQEIAALAHCQCDQITKYYDSFIMPGSSKLLIAMELMACSGSDLVRACRRPCVLRRCTCCALV
jgi:hypothetical protein